MYKGYLDDLYTYSNNTNSFNNKVQTFLNTSYIGYKNDLERILKLKNDYIEFISLMIKFNDLKTSINNNIDNINKIDNRRSKIVDNISNADITLESLNKKLNKNINSLEINKIKYAINLIENQKEIDANNLVTNEINKKNSNKIISNNKLELNSLDKRLSELFNILISDYNNLKDSNLDYYFPSVKKSNEFIFKNSLDNERDRFIFIIKDYLFNNKINNNLSDIVFSSLFIESNLLNKIYDEVGNIVNNNSSYESIINNGSNILYYYNIVDCVQKYTSDYVEYASKFSRAKSFISKSYYDNYKKLEEVVNSILNIKDELDDENERGFAYVHKF